MQSANVNMLQHAETVNGLRDRLQRLPENDLGVVQARKTLGYAEREYARGHNRTALGVLHRAAEWIADAELRCEQ